MKTIDRDIDLNTLPDFNGWYQNTNINLFDYAGMKLTPDLAIATIDLFFPKFTLYRGAIFLGVVYEEVFNEWFEHFDGNLTSIEKILNTIEVPDLFSGGSFEGQPYQNIEYIGKALKKGWEFELNQQFPDRDFEIIGYREKDYDNYIIAFWQNR